MFRKPIPIVAFAVTVSFAIGIAVFSSIGIDFVTVGFAEETENEVHLVSIYEGFEQTGDKIHGRKRWSTSIAPASKSRLC